MRLKLVAGNWKMYGDLARNQALLGALVAESTGWNSPEIAVCVPGPYLYQAQAILKGSVVGWGAQDLSEHPEGAYTGEVAGRMLTDFACRYVIVGHSERRTMHQESSELVANKAAAALSVGLVPIVCLGETLQEREAGETERVVASQLDAVIEKLGMDGLGRCVVAYEPVWAIGTGRTATPQQAQDVHAFLRQRVAGRDARVADGLRILYGGSVKPANAAELFAMPDLDGGLIGGASLVAKDFLQICRAAA